jgi:hypothetical protein
VSNISYFSWKLKVEGLGQNPCAAYECFGGQHQIFTLHVADQYGCRELQKAALTRGNGFDYHAAIY